MTKTELRIISLQFRTLSSQMLKIDCEDESRNIRIFLDFVNQTECVKSYIDSCHTEDYDFTIIIHNRNYGDHFDLPDSNERIVDYCYQLLTHIITNNFSLISLTLGYDKTRSGSIKAFMRKTIEPFVVILKNYLEIKLIECDNDFIPTPQGQVKAFLTYCQKDSKIADIIDSSISSQIPEDKLKITRDIRDVAYHQSFKSFMNSIEEHDYVLMLISDRYLKSQNCLYEVLETIKDTKFGDRLAFIVLCNDDKKYLESIDEEIGANVYSAEGQTSYILYWKNEEMAMNQRIQAINDPAATIGLSKELKHIRKIEVDIQDLLEYIKDHKGLPLQEHIDTNFYEILKFMNLK